MKKVYNCEPFHLAFKNRFIIIGLFLNGFINGKGFIIKEKVHKCLVVRSYNALCLQVAQCGKFHQVPGSFSKPVCPPTKVMSYSSDQQTIDVQRSERH